MNIKSALKKIRKNTRKLMALSIFFSQFINVFLPLYTYSNYGRAFASEVSESSESVTTNEATTEEPVVEETPTEPTTEETATTEEIPAEETQEGDILEDGASDVRTEEEVIEESTEEPEESDEPEEVVEVEELPAVEETEVVEETTEEAEETDVDVLGAADGTLEIEVIETYSCMANAINPCVITDKDDYGPTEVVLLEGHGYDANSTYTLRIWSDDDPAVEFETEIETDENGSFDASYQLDGTYRPQYYVEVLTIEEEEEPVVVAETSFTDSDVASHECTDDLQGANDEPGQKDLTQMCVDETNLPASINADWNWDDTGWSGANTGDACALFDTDGDGFANFASCVTVENDPATQKSTSPRIFTCNDTRSDRCAGDVLVAGPYTSSCGVSITTDQPFAVGDDTPNDTKASCTVQMSEVGGAGVAELIDVCSFPSDIPHSDPSDCIIFEPGTGRLEVVKDLIPGTDAGLFNLQIDGVTEAADVGDGGTTGEKILEVANNGTTFTVGETAGTGTSLSNYSTSIECRDINGTGSVVASGSNAGPLNVLLEEEDDVVCTITNTLQNGNIVVHKDVQGPDGEDITDASENFTVQLDGANSQLITDGGTVNYNDVVSGTHTITESVVPSGYTLYSIAPDSDGGTDGAQVTVVPGQTTDVYVVNRQNSATVTIHKDVVDSDGNDVSDTNEFTVQKDGGSDDTIAEGNDAVYTVAPGTYTFTEVDEDNYTLISITGDDDADETNGATVTVGPGGSAELTFVNKQDPGTISGYKYQADGVTGIFNWTISLYSCLSLGVDCDTFVASTTTDGSGFYSFTGLIAGFYQVVEDLIAGWTPVSVTSHDVEIDPGTESTQNNFSNFQNISISGQKFHDENNNSVNDSENGLENWTINLDIGADGSVEATTTTDSSGNYSFTDLGPGTYRVREVQQDGWVQTTADPADIIASDGTNVTGVDFGNFHPEPSLTTVKTLTATPSEILVGDTATYQVVVTNTGNVTLYNPVVTDYFETEHVDYDGSSPISESSYTEDIGADAGDYDNDGDTSELLGVIVWTIPVDLEPGEDYTITFYFTATSATPDNGEEELASNGLFTEVCTEDVEECDPEDELTTPYSYAGVDIDALGEASGYKFDDFNGDGQWGDEGTLGGVTINLYISDGESGYDPVASDVTESDGSYGFVNLVPGDYRVCEDVPTGYAQTFPGDDGCHYFTVTENGDVFEDRNFGNVQYGSIVVFKETNPDQSSENFEFDASYHDSNFFLTDGFFDLSGDLLPGTYSVTELPEEGWDLTSATCDDGSDPSSISLQSGETVVCTFTNTQRGHIIVDKITDPSGSEQGFDFDATGGTYADFTLTDADAPNDQELVPGTYGVSETVPAGWDLTNVTCTSSLQDNEIAGSLDLDAGETITCTFTNTELGNVIVVKYNDHNGNGIKDEGDEVLGDTGVGEEIEATRWEIHLVGTDVDSYQWTGTGDPAVAGQVTFSDLLPNSFTLSEQIKPGWVQTNITCGQEGEDYDATNDNLSFSLAAGEDLTCYIGNQGRGDVTVYKNVDTDGDGTVDVFNSDDWLYELDSADHTMGTTTNIAAGSYILDEFPQYGYHFVSLFCDEVDQEGAQTTVNVGPGSDIECTYTNARDTGTIIVHKIIDLDGDLETDDDRFDAMDWEMDVDGDSEDTSDPDSQDTDVNGEATFGGLKTGEYNVFETLQDGYDMLDAYCDDENSNWDGGIFGVDVGLDDIVNCYFINSPNGSIHGQKWLDENGDGFRDFEEPTLNGWRIFLDENENQTWDEGEEYILTQNHNEQDGWYWFEHLFPGTYTVCEELQDGWVQTSSPTCHTVEIPTERFENACPGPELLNSTFGSTCDFGNVPAEVNLLISKENDTGGADQQVGDTVLFTITVVNESTESTAYNVEVTDLPSEGFQYVSGSWTGIPTEPVYSSPGVWDLGDMAPGSSIVLTYQALITSIVDPGTYKDLAWAQGENIIGGVTLAQSQNPGVQDENYVGTEVIVVEEPEEEDLDVEVDEKTVQEEEVLGASIMPETGANSIWLVSMLTLLVTGISMMFAGILLRNKKSKNVKRTILNLIAAFALGAILNMGTAEAAQTYVSLEEPAADVSGNFELEFVALDNANADLDAECLVDKPGGGGFEVFQSMNLGPGGDSGVCNVDGSVLSEGAGTYAFRVDITGGSPSPLSSNEESTTYDPSGPGPEAPDYLRKERDGQCQYELEFKTENDGQTQSVVIYRDDDKEFTADNAHKIETINIGPDQEYTYENDLFGSDCGKTFYYAIRAFDELNGAGNGSPVVPEDDVIHTETIIIDEGTTGEGGTSLLAGTGTQVTTEGGTEGEVEVVTEGEEGEAGEEGAAEEGGEVLGAGDTSFGTFLKWLLVILAVIALVLYLLNRRKR